MIERMARIAAMLTTFEEAFDPETGSNATTPTERAVRIIVTSYETAETDGSLIQHGDLRVLIPAGEVTGPPPVSARLSFDGGEWQVQSVKPQYRYDRVHHYELQVRR